MVEQHIAVLLMAYGSPNSLEEVAEYLRQVRGGRSTTPAEVERLRDRYRKVGGQTPLLKITLAQRVRTGLDTMENPSDAAILFTAHSLPKRLVSEDDPYLAQLNETSRLVADQAGAGFWDFAFQSAGEPADSWLGPEIKEKIAELSGEGFREILVCPVGFVSDHLEILYDLDIEAKEYGLSLGARVARNTSPHLQPEFIPAPAAAA